MYRTNLKKLTQGMVSLVVFAGLCLFSKPGFSLTLAPIGGGGYNIDSYFNLKCPPGTKCMAEDISSVQNSFLPPPETFQEISSPAQVQENINWLPWIVNDPGEAMNFILSMLSSGETEAQRQALSDKLKELIPQLEELLSNSSQVKFRIGFSENGALLWEYLFVDEQGKEIAGFVFKHSPIQPAEGVLNAWQRTQTTIKIYGSDNEEDSEFVISLASDDSNDLIIEDKKNNKKLIIKTDGTIIEEPGAVNEVEDWLKDLNDSDPNKQLEAAIKLMDWLTKNYSHELASKVEKGLVETLPKLIMNEQLSEDKKKEIMDRLLKSHTGLDILGKIDKNADQKLKQEIDKLTGRILFDYLNDPDYQIAEESEWDPVARAINICINRLLDTEYGRNILKEIGKSEQEVVSNNLTNLLNRFLTATIRAWLPKIEEARERIDRIVEVMLGYEKGQAMLKNTLADYAEQGVDKEAELKAALTSLKNVLGEEEGKKLIDGIECSDSAKAILNQAWSELISPQQEVDKLIEQLNNKDLSLEKRIAAAKRLGEIGGEKAIQALLKVWQEYHRLFPVPTGAEILQKMSFFFIMDEDLMKLGAAITQVLISMGEQVVEPLIALFKNPDTLFATRGDILDVLDKIGSEKAIPLFKHVLTENWLHERFVGLKKKAVEYFIRMNKELAQEFFVKVLSQPDNYSELARECVINGLVKIGDNEAVVKTLLHTLENDPSEFIRSCAALGLAELGKAEAVEPILRQLVTSGRDSRANLNKALKSLVERIEDPALKQLVSTAVDLVDAIEENDEEKLLSNIAKLGELKDVRALPFLTRLLADFKEKEAYLEKIKEGIISIVRQHPAEGVGELKRIFAGLSEEDALRPILKAIIEGLEDSAGIPPQPPLAPVGLKTTVTGDKIGIAWDKVGDATGYEVSVEGEGFSRNYRVDSAAITRIELEKTREGLAPGKEYTVKVKALKGDLVSPWSAAAKFKIEPPEEGPITLERIFREFGIKLVSGDLRGIDLSYQALKENYGFERPPGFEPQSIIYSSGIPQADIEAVYRTLKSLPQQFIDGLKGKTIKLYSDILPYAGGGIAGATYVEEPQIEEDHIYIFFSKAIEHRYTDSLESVLTHELMHVVYRTGLQEADIQKLAEIFWHGESDIQKVLANLNDFADDRIKFYRNKPNPQEIIMEDWAYGSTRYLTDSLSLIELAMYRTSAGLSTPITLPGGEVSSVIKEKVKFLAGLFRHTVNGTDMTYIYKTENNRLMRAEVRFTKDGLPDIMGPIRWEVVE